MPFAEAPYDEWWYREHVPEKYCNFVYIVYWPADEIVKVGSTANPQRWRGFCRRGALLLAVIKHGPLSLETDLQDLCEAAGGLRAFDSKWDAVPWLGSHGAGYLECYYVDRDALFAVLDAAKEVESALVQG